ncbi:MAG: hypothetical protein ACRELY_30160, partial [Polyangiaceae bacterium]
AHGLPRSTQDLDIVIDPPDAAAIDALLSELPANAYYVDSDTAHDAFRRRSLFNVIDMASGWKIDLIVRKNRDFSRSEMARRVAMPILGIPLFVASPEDTIVAKLEWSRDSGGSERQRGDVRGILAALGNAVDREYVEKWVHALGLEAEWAAAGRAP